MPRAAFLVTGVPLLKSRDGQLLKEPAHVGQFDPRSVHGDSVPRDLNGYDFVRPSSTGFFFVTASDYRPWALWLPVVDFDFV